MELKNVDELFEKYCFKKEKLYVYDEELPFKNVYINRYNTEAYIVEQISLDELNNNKIEEYEEQILWFENFTEEYYLKYNMNLMILYKEDKKNKIQFNDFIQKYERDSNICKKIFLDINNKENTFILPFVNIENSINKEDIPNPFEKLRDILKNDELILELGKKNINDEYMEKNILHLFDME